MFTSTCVTTNYSLGAGFSLARGIHRVNVVIAGDATQMSLDPKER